MKKFHISKDGQARECRAEVSCRLGGEDRHFETKEAARDFFEQEAEEKFGAMLALRKGITLPDSGGHAYTSLQIGSDILKPFVPSESEAEFIKIKAKARIGELNSELKRSDSIASEARERYIALGKNPAARIFKRAELKKAREELLSSYRRSSILRDQIGALTLGLKEMQYATNQVKNNIQVDRIPYFQRALADNLKKKSQFYKSALSQDFDESSRPRQFIDPLNEEKRLS